MVTQRLILGLGCPKLGENMQLKNLMTAFALTAVLGGCENPPQAIDAKSSDCKIEIVVLGVGQDAGAPQIGNPDDPAWNDPSKKLYATSLGLLDHDNRKRYLFEATPDIREQMQIMDSLLPYDGEGPYIDGIFLTHAHMGHYAGLMFLGRESMGAKGVPVYVMPRMKAYLEDNGPWSQLVELGNIILEPMSLNVKLSENLSVGQFEVPHRDEFSETVAFTLLAADKSALFLPDLDSWEKQSEKYESFGYDGYHFPKMAQNSDYAFIDATFYDDHELSGRDMSQIPHPRVTTSMDLSDRANDESLKEKVRFIHMNHTNPLRDKNSDAFKEMTVRGYKRAYRGDRYCL